MAENAGERLLTSFARTCFGQGQCVTAVRVRRGRCASALLSLAGGERVFVKQDLTQHLSLLQREASMLKRLEIADGAMQPSPRLIAFEKNLGILITRGIKGYVPLDRLLKRSALADPAAAVATGAALARLHQHSFEDDGATLDRVVFPLEPIAALTPDQLVTRPADYAQLAAALEESSGTISKLSSRWRHTYLIHGDFKADNLLLKVDHRIVDGLPIMIVDWEMAGLGDPMWDVGSYLGSLLLVWIGALAPETATTEIHGGPDVDSLRRQIGYFLITYRHMAPHVFEATPAFTLTALEYAGVFLLHRIFVGLDITGFLGSGGSLVLEFARSFLNHPSRAAEALLGGLAL